MARLVAAVECRENVISDVFAAVGAILKQLLVTCESLGLSLNYFRINEPSYLNFIPHSI